MATGMGEGRAGARRSRGHSRACGEVSWALQARGPEAEEEGKARTRQGRYQTWDSFLAHLYSLLDSFVP